MTTMTTTPSFTLRNGATFTSRFDSLPAALEYLRGCQLTAGSFAADLAARRSFSPAQVAWVHKLATERLEQAMEREAARLAPVVPDACPMPRTLGILHKAASAQKAFPTIRLGSLRLGLTGSRSRLGAGALSVVVVDGGERRGLLQADQNGTVVWLAKGATAEQLALLANLEADPSKVLGQHGVATGVCCCCGRPLSDKRSREVGYGPICAEKFGLPWGGPTPGVDAANEEASKQ